MDRKRVILYGRSMILATLDASLDRYPEFEIIALSPPMPEAEELDALAPDVILFDVNAGRPEPAFALLINRPNLLLVGVNPENDQLLLWSSGQSNVLSTDDIVQAIARISE